MKIILGILTLIVIYSFMIDSDDCYLHIFDQKTKKPILTSQVFSKEKEFITIGNGRFKIPCDFNDSIVIHAPGFEDSVLVFNPNIDTIYLNENSLELEPVSVIGQSKKSKRYQIGKKNKKIDAGYGFWVGRRKNEKPLDFKFASIFPNPSGVRMKVEEGYIYITDKDSLTNLYISFYKNNNGKLGDLILDKIEAENIKKTKGWCKLILNEKLILPKDGYIVIIKKIDLHQKTSIGLIEYKSEMGINSFGYLDNYLVRLLDMDFQNMGAKLYFKVR